MSRILKLTLTDSNGASAEIEIAPAMVDTKDVTAQHRCLADALQHLKNRLRAIEDDELRADPTRMDHERADGFNW